MDVLLYGAYRPNFSYSLRLGVLCFVSQPFHIAIGCLAHILNFGLQNSHIIFIQ